MNNLSNIFQTVSGTHRYKLIHPLGYIWIYRPNHPFATNNYVLEHRIVYEEYYKCNILPWIDIHHINHIKDDNRIENLRLMTRTDHRRLERIGYIKDMSNRICYRCGSRKTRIRKKTGRPYWYNKGRLCSRCYDSGRDR